MQDREHPDQHRRSRQPLLPPLHDGAICTPLGDELGPWRAKLIAAKIPGADTYFRSLPGGRSLSQVLADRSVWINFAPSIDYYGETIGDKEVAIGPLAYRWGHWTVLGTLIHELAHANGAPGGASRAAEEALLHCGLGKLSEQNSGVDDLGTPFVPGIEG